MLSGLLNSSLLSLFLNPIGLALLGLCPFLIFAYRKKVSAKKKIVSSTILLKQLKLKPRKKQKIKLPLRFYIELLALCLLCLALALPTNKDKDIAVVFDNSLSMSALEENGKTRIGLAKEQFEENKKGDKYKIFNISNPNSPDKINKELEEINNKANFDEIWIYSDKEIISKQESLNDKIKSFTIGEKRKNLFILDAKIKDQEIIANLSHQDALVSIRLEKIDFSGNLIEVLDNRQVEVKTSYQYKYKPVSAGTAYKISVSTSNEDSIKNDNYAWIVNAPQKTGNALLISEQEIGSSNKLLGLNKIDSLKITKKSEYDGKEYSLLIFHRVVPKIFPKIPSLYILPAGLDKSEDSISELKTSNRSDVNITYWNKSHVINSYLKLNLIKSIDAVNIDPPLWSSSIINSEKGSLLTVGIKNSVPVALSGIELLPYEGLKTPTLSILLVNIIKWLDQNKSISTNTSDKIKIYNNSIVITPEQDVLKDLKEIKVETPGIYLFSPENRALAVNNFHEEESNLSKRHIQEIELSENKEKKKESNLWRYLIYACIFFLLIEMILRRKND